MVGNNSEAVQLEVELTADKLECCGNSTDNDGNIARCFVCDPELAASITGLDQEIIQCFADVLQVILCGQEIHSEAFTVRALETAKLFVEKYPGFTCQPASIKFLFTKLRLLTLKAQNFPLE